MAYEPKALNQTIQQGSMLSTAPTTLGVLPRFYGQQRKAVFVLKPKTFGFSGEDWVTVSDVNGNPAFKVRAEAFSLSHRVHVSDPEGQQLFTIRREPSFGPFKAYAEDPQGHRVFEFNGVRSFGGMKNKVSFINAADGRNVHLQMKMGMFDKYVDIRLADTDTLIASIERPGWMSAKFVITVAPNVDTSPVVAMCICLHKRIQARKKSSRSGAASGFSGGGGGGC